MSLIPVLSHAKLLAWPKNASGGRVQYVRIGEMLETRYPTDAHFAGYSVPYIQRRLDTSAVRDPAHANKLLSGVPMAIATFDVDCEDSHQSGGTAPDVWWTKELQKITQLVEQHPRLFAYRTRGGYRAMGALPEPIIIRNTAEDERWTSTYLEWVAYLRRMFGIFADPFCSDWTRLFRAPHATRDRNTGPEEREALGDPSVVGPWECEPTADDIAVARTLKPKKPPKRTRTSERPASSSCTGEGVLFHAFRSRGELGPAIEPGKWAVQCPWEKRHSKGARFDSSTVLFAPGPGETLGFFLCSHAHCQSVTAADVRAHFTADEFHAATVAAGFAGSVGGSQRKPEIRYSFDVDRIVNEAIDALRADPDLYVRGGALTRVIATDGSAPPSQAIQRDTGAPVIRRVASACVLERLSIHAHFLALKSEGRGASKRSVLVRASPPAWLPAHVIERGRWDGYRALAGVITAPTVRRNGSVLQVPGYDVESGLLYIPNGRFPEVKDRPTRDEAIAARDELLEVVDDFEIDDLGRAWWLSLLFTLLARDLVDGATPLFAADAPVAGAGKGLLVRVAHRIPLGTDPPHMSLPPNDEEMRKQITTCLLAGDPAVLLDNVSVPLGGDSLDAVITAPIWKVRLLSKNEDCGALVPRAVWMATGNGLELVGDMGRRTLRLRIVSSRESPEDRDNFRHKDRIGVAALLAWVTTNRPRLVHAGLTCLRAWVVDGGKSTTAYWGSFEGWASTVAACVAWLDMPDPTTARASRDAMMDPRRSALAAVYHAIYRLQNSRGVTARELVNAAYPVGGPADDDLAAALGVLLPDRPRLDQRAFSLGNKLRASRERVVDVRIHPEKTVSLRLMSQEARAGVLRWTVMETGQ